MPSPTRVVARYLQADAIGDPKALLEKFSEQVEAFAKVEPKAKKLLDILGEMERAQDRNEPWEFNRLHGQWQTTDYKDVADVYVAVEYGFKRMRGVGNLLFLSILQQLAVPPNKVKKVQAAAKFWSKAKMVLRKDKRKWAPRHTEDVVAYGTLLSTYREQVALVTDLLATAKPHGTEETPKLKAGPFTLVNTGNFDAPTMERVRDTVEKAAKAMTSAGFGKVCYGDIMVSNTITSKSDILAFYLTTKDEMFVRANVKPNIDSVQTICHELAHRLQFKFLASKTDEIRTLYQSIARHVRFGGPEIPKEAWPEIGREVEYKGDKLVVLNVSQTLNKIEFGEPPAPGVYRRKVYKAPVEWWLRNIEGKEPERGPDFKGFITTYAQKGGPDENFAEMVAFYALGKLPKGLTDLLLPIVG